eukprot:SAG25_NODE_2576_length_1521_cov_1.254571_1_plen_402_part_10
MAADSSIAAEKVGEREAASSAKEAQTVETSLRRERCGKKVMVVTVVAGIIIAITVGTIVSLSSRRSDSASPMLSSGGGSSPSPSPSNGCNDMSNVSTVASCTQCNGDAPADCIMGVCAAGKHTYVAGDPPSCTGTCTEQTGCATSTVNTCSTGTTYTVCKAASVGYYLNGELAVALDASNPSRVCPPGLFSMTGEGAGPAGKCVPYCSTFSFALRTPKTACVICTTATNRAPTDIDCKNTCEMPKLFPCDRTDTLEPMFGSGDSRLSAYRDPRCHVQQTYALASSRHCDDGFYLEIGEECKLCDSCEDEKMLLTYVVFGIYVFFLFSSASLVFALAAHRVHGGVHPASKIAVCVVHCGNCESANLIAKSWADFAADRLDLGETGARIDHSDTAIAPGDVVLT